MRITPEWLREDWEKLRGCPVLGPHVRESDPPTLNQADDLFEDLVSSIVYQQLSGKAAAAIWARFLDLFGEAKKVSPEALSVMDSETLRSVGLSRQKASYVVDLAQRVSSGALPLAHLPELSDQEVHEHLTQVKGIGPWTADMMLIFSLHRRDVFPCLDLGIKRGLQRALGSEKEFKPDEMAQEGLRWDGFRTAASLALWRAVDTTTPGS